MLICSSCQQTKASLKNDLHCGICQKLICKDCTQFLEESFFSFLRNIPADLKHTSYCWACYDQKIVPAMKPYLEMMERAKNVHVFYKNERNVPITSRSNVRLVVENCPDKKETLLRLAFLAAEKSCNAVVDVDLNSEKVKTSSGYQKSRWSATGYPAQARASGISGLARNIT